MKNVTVNNIEYIEADNGYCYKIENGSKKRISKAVYDEVTSQVQEQETPVQEEPVNEVVPEVVSEVVPEDEPMFEVKDSNRVTIVDIQQIFSDKVKEYLDDKNMMIYPKTMSGSQGEIANIDVTDKKDVYRIRLYSTTKFPDGDDKTVLYSVDMLVLEVERYADEFKRTTFDSLGDTLWNGYGEIVERLEWYSPNHRRGVVFFNNYEDVKEFARIRLERLRANTPKISTEYDLPLPEGNNELRTKVRDLIRKHKGYMRIKRAHIARITRVLSGPYGGAGTGVVYKAYFTEECGKDALILKVTRK